MGARAEMLEGDASAATQTVIPRRSLSNKNYVYSRWRFRTKERTEALLLLVLLTGIALKDEHTLQCETVFPSSDTSSEELGCPDSSLTIPCSRATTASASRGILLFDARNASTTMETEYAEETGERKQKVAIAGGTGHVQVGGGEVVAVCPQLLSVNYSSSSRVRKSWSNNRCQ